MGIASIGELREEVQRLKDFNRMQADKIDSLKGRNESLRNHKLREQRNELRDQLFNQTMQRTRERYAGMSARAGVR